MNTRTTHARSAILFRLLLASTGIQAAGPCDEPLTPVSQPAFLVIQGNPQPLREFIARQQFVAGRKVDELVHASAPPNPGQVARERQVRAAARIVQSRS